MNIPIKYNDVDDEFINDLTLQMRLENYIKRHFYSAYIIARLVPIYLVGGSIRDLIYAKRPKDLDFVVLGKENLDWIMQVFEKFGINYSFNSFGGFKFEYNNIKIDLWLNDDLFSSMQYNVDGLFFNLNNNSLLSLTFEDFVNNGLKLLNSENNIEKGREKKLVIFERNYLNNSKNYD